MVPLPQDYGNEVRGCHTYEEIVEDEVIIEVPLKCLITVEMGKETKVNETGLNENRPSILTNIF